VQTNPQTTRQSTPKLSSAQPVSEPPVDRVPDRPARFGAAELERLARLIARGASTVHDDRGGESSTARAPFSLDPTVALPCSSVEDVAAAVTSARRAQPAWAATSMKQRAAIALRFHDLLLERQDEVLDLIQWETGKARFHAYQEVAQVAMLARHYARRGAHYLADQSHRGFLIGFTKVREVRVPKGVIGMISPWNYPLYLGVGDVLPALLAGNAVVSKADSQSPLTLLWALALLREAGLPDALWQVAVGRGSVVGSAIIDTADYICFTGSTATGRRVAERAGRRLIGVSLELGGKNPAIVCDDADLAAAAQGIVLGAFTNAGQLCFHLVRVYVQRAVHADFVARLVAATRALKLGQAYDYEADVGCLVSPEQLAQVEHHVDDAVMKGARVLTGGGRRPDVGPLAYEPTVLEGVTPDMVLYAEETFGPVLAIYPVDSDDEALQLANASSYGLSASVWSRDPSRAEALARRIRCGAININDGAAAAAGSIEAPMGGMGDSGLGRRLGTEVIRKYTEAQTIAAQRLMPLAPPRGMPLARYASIITRLLKAMRTLCMR
jgi:succinate-semialdehyde dehydrogenase/glutarate-semialdehyde dehydrogenase